MLIHVVRKGQNATLWGTEYPSWHHICGVNGTTPSRSKAESVASFVGLPLDTAEKGNVTPPPLQSVGIFASPPRHLYSALGSSSPHPLPGFRPQLTSGSNPSSANRCSNGVESRAISSEPLGSTEPWLMICHDLKRTTG